MGRVRTCWGGAILGGGGAIPGREGRHCFEAVGVADHLVQRVDDLPELGPVVAVLLPAVQHELVQGAWAVHGWWQPIVLLYGINYLGTTPGLSGVGLGGWGKSICPLDWPEGIVQQTYFVVLPIASTFSRQTQGWALPEFPPGTVLSGSWVPPPPQSWEAGP